MMPAPFVIVTSTTELIRDRPRVRVNEAYTNALAAVGLVPVVLPPISPEMAARALESAAGLVLTGGEDLDPTLFGEAPRPETGAPHPARDAYEIALARAARAARLPTLAICRGAQIMNVALGGTLFQDLPTQRPGGLDHDPKDQRDVRVHRVAVEPASRLARVLGGSDIVTNSSHHQSVACVADPLLAVGTSEDGIIEAIEARDPDWWMIAVQWHPEELTTTAEEWDRRLFGAFADAVRATSEACGASVRR